MNKECRRESKVATPLVKHDLQFEKTKGADDAPFAFADLLDELAS